MTSARARSALVLVTLGVVTACAQVIGLGPVPTPADAASDAGDADELPPFDAAGCDACAAVPPGWTPILVSTTASACPSGYGTSESLETSPTFEAGACTCVAQDLVPPDCTTGTASFVLGCTGGTVSFPVSDGGCSSFTPTTLQTSERVPTVAPSPGSCTAKPQADPGKLGTTALVACATSGCPAEACAGSPPAGFSGCIEHLGDASCPPAFPNATSAATQYGLDCSSACGACTASAVCSNGAMTLYDSCTSQGLVVALNANDQCYAGLPPGTVSGAVYAAYTTSVAYTPDPAKPPVATAQNGRTICCR